MLTAKDLLETKGKRRLTYVQVSREEEATAASQAGIDMVGTGSRADTAYFARATPQTHFQFGLIWG